MARRNETSDEKGPFARAFELRNAGDPAAATEFRRALSEYPECAAGWLVLCGLLNEQREYAEAKTCAQRVLTLKPTSAFASRAFFHACLHTGDDDEAVTEARRFLQLARDGAAKIPPDQRRMYEGYDEEGTALAEAWRRATHN